MRVYHYHIRKTGGTSLNESFFQLACHAPEKVSEEIRRSGKKTVFLNGLKFVGANVDELRRDDYFYGFSHFPQHKFLPSPNILTIAIFRDPVERLVSHYRMLLGMVEKNISRPWLAVEAAWLGESIIDFAEKMPKEKMLSQIYTFSEEMDVLEATSNIRRVSHLIFNDKYTDGIYGLSSKIGVSLAERCSHQSHANFRLSRKELKVIKGMLRQEYLMLNRIR